MREWASFAYGVSLGVGVRIEPVVGFRQPLLPNPAQRGLAVLAGEPERCQGITRRSSGVRVRAVHRLARALAPLALGAAVVVHVYADRLVVPAGAEIGRAHV